MPREPPVTRTVPLPVLPAPFDPLRVYAIAPAFLSGESVIIHHLLAPAPGLEDPPEVVRPIGWVELDEAAPPGARASARRRYERVCVQPKAVEGTAAADGAVDHPLLREDELRREL